MLVLLAAADADYVLSRRRWRASNVRFTRRLPAAFAIGVERPVRVTFEHDGAHEWTFELYDHVDSSVDGEGLACRRSRCATGKRVEAEYTRDADAPRRDHVRAGGAARALGARASASSVCASAPPRRGACIPISREIARYAWLAGDRRLQEIGIKTFQQRGEGTDFKQLAEYRHGDSVRHIDWKATLRLDKPIVREFQDERDQRVMLLIDCGRRMRADDRRGAVGTAHFDQVLNAVMLLSYVALAQGDAVGALTFGTPPGDGAPVRAAQGRAHR